MASLNTEFVQHPTGPLVIKLAGRLDGNSAPAFGRELATHLQSPAAGAVLAVGGLEYISSAGLREFMTLARKLHQNKAKGVLVGVSAAVNEVLEISGMGSLFLRAASEEEALRLQAVGGSGLLGRLFARGSAA